MLPFTTCGIKLGWKSVWCAVRGKCSLGCPPMPVWVRTTTWAACTGDALPVTHLIGTLYSPRKRNNWFVLIKHCCIKKAAEILERSAKSTRIPQKQEVHVGVINMEKTLPFTSVNLKCACLIILPTSINMECWNLHVDHLFRVQSMALWDM